MAEVCGPFGPYQEIVALATFALHRIVDAVRDLWTSARPDGLGKGHHPIAR
jgi:hypothetical protein